LTPSPLRNDSSHRVLASQAPRGTHRPTGTTAHALVHARLCPAGQQKAKAKEASAAAHLELAKKVQTEVAGSGQQQYLLGNLAFSVPSSWTPDESAQTISLLQLRRLFC
jgi:hypothetical protein